MTDSKKYCWYCGVPIASATCFQEVCGSEECEEAEKDRHVEEAEREHDAIRMEYGY